MAMYNELVLENIASFLCFNDLKSCRGVNFLWKDIMTAKLKKRGIGSLQLNENSIDSIVNSDPEDEFLWDSVDLDWGFGHSKPESIHKKFAQFFFKFGVNIKKLQWTGADLTNEDHKLWDKSSKLSMAEMFERMKKSDSDMGKQLGEFLYLMPNLESLTIGKPETSYGPLKVKQCKPVTDTLIHLSKLRVSKLTTLNLSSHAFLTVQDMTLLKNLGLKMKNFTWLGNPINWQNGIPMGELLNSWNSTLENLHFNYSPNFSLGPMPVLKSFRVEILFQLLNPLPFVEQFPVLEDMNWNFEPNFNWDRFIPAQMPAHVHLRRLNLLKSHDNNIPVPSYIRLLQKCPKLKSLTTSVICDDVAKAIFQNNHDLEHLETNPAGCSPETFSGVEDPFNREASAQDLLNPNIFSIRKLTKLRDVKISGTIDDTSVWFGIALLKNLEKLELPTGGITDLSLLSFMTRAPKLRELTLTLSAIEDLEIELSQDGLNSLGAARPDMRIEFVGQRNFWANIV